MNAIKNAIGVKSENTGEKKNIWRNRENRRRTHSLKIYLESKNKVSVLKTPGQRSTLTFTFPPIRSGGSSSVSKATLMVAKGLLAICCISLRSCCGERRKRRFVEVTDRRSDQCQ